MIKKKIKPGPAKLLIPDFSALSQTVVASIYRCTTTAVCQWECPKNKDGTYNLSEIIKWREEKLNTKPKSQVALSIRMLELKCEKLDLELADTKQMKMDVDLHKEEIRQIVHSIKRFFTESFKRNVRKMANKPVSELLPIIATFMTEAFNTYADLPEKEQ